MAANNVTVKNDCTLANLATEDRITYTFDATQCTKTLASRAVAHVVTEVGEIYDVDKFEEGLLKLKQQSTTMLANPLQLVHMANLNEFTIYTGKVAVDAQGDLVIETATDIPVNHVRSISKVLTKSSVQDVTPEEVTKIVFNDLTRIGVKKLTLIMKTKLPVSPQLLCRIFVKSNHINGCMVMNATGSFIDQINDKISENSKGITNLQDLVAFNSLIGKVTTDVLPILSINPEAEAEARTFVELYVGQKVYDTLASVGSGPSPHPDITAMYAVSAGDTVSKASSFINSNNASYHAMISDVRTRITDKLGGSKSNDERSNNMVAALERYKYENMRLSEVIRELKTGGNDSRVNTIAYVSLWLAVGVINTAVCFFMPVASRSRMFIAMALMVVYLVGFVVAVVYGISKRT